MKRNIVPLLLAYLIVSACAVMAQSVDSARTTILTLAGAEERLRAFNPQILASRNFEEEALALAKQAGLWTNPTLSVEQNLYNPETRKVLDVTSTGNTDVTIAQTFLLAGKRGKSVRVAELTAIQAGTSASDLLRTLRHLVRKDFFDLSFAQKSILFYDESIEALRRTVTSAGQSNAGETILLSDLLRVKSLLVTFEGERLAMADRERQIQADLHVLLSDSGTSRYVSRIDSGWFRTSPIDTLTVQSAIRAALLNRPDLIGAETALQTAEAGADLQHAMAVPDLTLGGHWSRAGGYIPNYGAITLSIDLPLFNRNQGNIDQAELSVQEHRRLLEQSRSAVTKEVESAFDRAAATDRLWRSTDQTFLRQYEDLVSGMIESYRQHNISAMQFADFYESYRSSIMQLNQLENDRVDAFEDLYAAMGVSGQTSQ